MERDGKSKKISRKSTRNKKHEKDFVLCVINHKKI